MNFYQIDEIVAGRKTQTRRIFKPGFAAIYDRCGQEIISVVETENVPLLQSGKMPIKWQVGREMAVSFGVAKAPVYWDSETGKWHAPIYGGQLRDGYAPLMIRLKEIRKEILHRISYSEAMREGIFESGNGYMHSASDKVWGNPKAAYADLWDSVYDSDGIRWVDNPYVWVIEFELVLPTTATNEESDEN